MRSRGLLGYLFGLAGFTAICLAALLSPWGPDTRFSGLAGIQDDLTERVENILVAGGVPASNVKADGRDITVTLNEAAGVDLAAIQAQLEAEDGVGSVTLVDGPASADQSDDPDVADGADPITDPDDASASDDPDASDDPADNADGGDDPDGSDDPAESADGGDDPDASDDPVEEPTVEPTEEPAATVEPEPEPTEEPTAAPEPSPTPEPQIFSAAQAVAAGLDASDVEFAVGSATLSETEGLDEIAVLLQDVSQGQIEVQAHTNNAGDPDVNLLLSEDRAQAITDYLVSKGVAESVLVPRGYGGSQPIADNSTEQGRRANERVVLVVEGN